MTTPLHPAAQGAQVRLTLDGQIPKQLFIDGVELHHVAGVTVIAEPYKALMLHIELYCASIETTDDPPTP